MADLRFDPLTGHWVAIARNRLDRPTEFVPIEQIRQQLICPFCRGNEDETPDMLAAYLDTGEPLSESDDPSSWTVRVVPNKYPSFAPSPRLDLESGPYESNNGIGSQELIIPSHRHVTSLSELTNQELNVAFMACQQRLAVYAESPEIKHGMLFMNCRSPAGASLGHIHLQLIGSPIVSDYLKSRTERNLESIQQHGQSLVRRILNFELEQKRRIILESENFVVFCPYASRFPFQVWIVPKENQGAFMDCAPSKRNELAQLSRLIVEKLESQLDEPAYNLLLNIAPYESSEYDHWYFELFPRLTVPAGFEWGTNVWVNPVPPETAAKRLQ